MRYIVQNTKGIKCSLFCYRLLVKSLKLQTSIRAFLRTVFKYKSFSRRPESGFDQRIFFLNTCSENYIFSRFVFHLSLLLKYLNKFRKSIILSYRSKSENFTFYLFNHASSSKIIYLTDDKSIHILGWGVLSLTKKVHLFQATNEQVCYI